MGDLRQHAEGVGCGSHREGRHRGGQSIERGAHRRGELHRSPARACASKPQTIAPGKSAEFRGGDRRGQSQAVGPGDRSSLYTRHVPKCAKGKNTLDDETVPFGIREARFDADTGFWLNGKNFKIKGVCLHGDGGAVGTAVPLDVWERRLTALKKDRRQRASARRTIRVAPEFLDLCDRMGFLVMDEMFDQWTVAKNPYDYHLFFRDWSHVDTRDTVRRDRNHPSVIIYSAGNEIHDTPKAELAKGILQGPGGDLPHRATPRVP